MSLLRAQAPAPQDLSGLRGKIDHIVVIFQENRSFDHYFGAYRSPHGASIEGILDRDGKVDDRFSGQQRSPDGAPYKYLPVPYQIPGFAGARLENRPFRLSAYLPPGDNVHWDPLHHFYRMFAQIDRGKMDYFVALAQTGKHVFSSKSNLTPAQAMMAASSPSAAVLGYYTRDDLPDYYRLADEYVLLDHFFQAMSGGSTGNALYLVAARSAVSSKAPQNKMGGPIPPLQDLSYDQHGILINDLPPLNGPTETFLGDLAIAPPPEEQTYPTIGDRLEAASREWVWYNEGWENVQRWALKSAFGPGDGSIVVDDTESYLPHHNPFQYFPSWQRNVKAGRMRDSADFLEDAKQGKLPSVAFLKGTGSSDEHPADSAPRWGEQWVMTLLRALGQSSAWERTAVVITYDEGGGFWDHVAPPRPDAYGCGTRIPALLISPFARRGYVDHRIADTTSVLALIEARFGLSPLQSRDAGAYNLLEGFDFTQKPRPPAFG